MSDFSVAEALRSQAQVVVVEAPAGCGKTFQGSMYAKQIAAALQHERVLILAHTHAACDVFADRTRGCSERVEVCTIDSLICNIANAYHSCLGLPPDCGSWARKQSDGYSVLATKVSHLLRRSRIIAAALARRYPIVICDEHQDAAPAQHAIAISCRDAGSRLRIFGDPMQCIYSTSPKQMDDDIRRWTSIKETADAYEELDTPHRWAPSSEALGNWILDNRALLRDGGCVDLTKKLPKGVSFIVADNESRDPRGYSLSGDGAKQLYSLVRGTSRLLILTPHNQTVQALRALFNRTLPIWEGHVRDDLSTLSDTISSNQGDPIAVGEAFCKFLTSVAVGCSSSALGAPLLNEIKSRFSKARTGKPAAIQGLARMIVDQPDHRGVARALRQLDQLARNDRAFQNIAVDYYREFWEAVRLGQFDTAEQGLAELTRRRSAIRPMPPPKAISTIHKAKGLECAHVVVVPCDSKHFGNSQAARFKLYVAMSRAMSSLTFVISKRQPSPLFNL